MVSMINIDKSDLLGFVKYEIRDILALKISLLVENISLFSSSLFS